MVQQEDPAIESPELTNNSGGKGSGLRSNENDEEGSGDDEEEDGDDADAKLGGGVCLLLAVSVRGSLFIADRLGGSAGGSEGDSGLGNVQLV